MYACQNKDFLPSIYFHYNCNAQQLIIYKLHQLTYNAIYIANLIGIIDKSCRLWSDTFITKFRFGDNCAGYTSTAASMMCTWGKRIISLLFLIVIVLAVPVGLHDQVLTMS